MPKPIISVSGLRGIVGQSIDPFLAQRYALAFAQSLPPGKIILGRDGRETGEMFARAISAALMGAGFEVLYADVAATPTIGVLCREFQCSGGLQISASHNPPEYNGIKLFGRDGRVISAESGQAVIDAYQKNEFHFVNFDEVGECHLIEDTTSAHLTLVLGTVDVESIRKMNFKVVLDSNHGAGSILAQRLFEALNCEATILGNVPDGQFDHVPEPTAENLADVARSAVSSRADVIFCQDPDADRLAVIDETGNYIGEEYTLAITLKHALGQAASHGFGDFSKNVVINCATSRMSVDIAEQYDCECQISAVGEANVTQQMLESNAVYGGEGNGGPIDPRVGFVRDSFVAMAQILDHMAASGQRPSELVKSITPYSIVKSKLQLETEKILPAFDELEQEFKPDKSNRMDGLRMDFANSWLLVRGSNTEPIVRVIAESTTQADAQELVDRATSIISKVS